MKLILFGKMDRLCCCICRNTLHNTLYDIFNDRIGTPQMLISSIIEEFADVNKLLKKSFICIQCRNEVLKYYEASQIMQRIKHELLSLINQTIFQVDCKYSESFHLSDDKRLQNNKWQEMNNEVLSEHLIEYIDPEEEHSTFDNFENAEVDRTVPIKDTQNKDERFDDFSVQPELMCKVMKSAEPCKSDPKIFPCTICSEIFTEKRNLKKHKNIQHCAGYVCEQCGKKLMSHAGLTAHIESHNAIRKYECPTCGLTFNRKFYLTDHMSLHSGENTFECDICCKRFSNRVALKKHQKWHNSNERQLECKICSCKFRTSSHLRRHMLSHTGAKPHCCPICSKRFSQAYNMRVHIQEHEQPGSTRRSRFKCKKCKRTFTNKENYEKHSQLEKCEEIESTK